MPVTINTSNPDKIKEIKSILRSLLIAKGSRDVSLKQLNSMYKEMEGKNIPFREYGYASLDNFLNDLPDTLKLMYNRNNELCAYHINTEKSAHISSLVARQKKAPIRKSKSSYNYKPRNNYYNFPKPLIQNKCEVSISVIDKVLQELREASRNSRNNGGIRKVDVLARVRGKDSKYSSFSILDLNSRLQQLSHILHIEDDYIYFKDDIKNQKVPSKLPYENELCKRNENISKPMQSLDKDEFMKTQQNASVYSNDLITLVSKVEQICDNVQETDDNQKSQVQEIDTSSDLISERTKIRLEKLIEKHPEGIWCSELPNLYKSEYSVDLEYKDLGFNSITEFVAALTNIFQIVEPPNTKRQMVLNAKMPINCSENNSQRKTLASQYNFDDYLSCEPDPVPIKLSSKVSQTLIPEGFIGLDETVDQIHVTSLTSEEYIEVIVSDIFTPTFFWITLRRNKKKLKGLMSGLDEFYHTKDLDMYKIPQVVLQPGLNIACVYANIWHRAIIKKIKPDGFVVVLFYDYGTVKTYDPNELYFLHKRFTSLPAQAIACGLHNVRPICASDWSNESINAFIKKAYNIPLIAIISSINEENNTMMITLTDTSDDETDLHINDWLVENKLADWGKMVNSVPIHKLCIYDQLELHKLQNENYSQPQVNKKICTDFESKRFDTASSITNSNYLDSYYDTSNVATLLKENTDLAKQTHTFVQAIVLNMPVNKSEVLNDNYNIKTDKMFDNQSTNLQVNKKCVKKLNNSFNNEKTHFSDVNSNVCGIDYNQYVSTHPKQYNNYDRRLSVETSFSSTSQLENKLGIENKASNFEQEPSVPQDVDNQKILVFDTKFVGDSENSDNTDNFSDGTPFIEVKREDYLRKESNHIKHPSENLNSFNHFNLSESKLNCSNVNASNIENFNTSLKKCERADEEYCTSRISSVINKIKIDELSPKRKCFENLNEFSKQDEVDEGYFTGTRPSTSQTNSNKSSTSNSRFSGVPVYITIHLSERCDKKLIHIFHLEDQGWLSTNEFVNAFTNLKDQRVMLKLLQMLDYNVNFKYITRESEPIIFSQIDKSKLKVPRDDNKNVARNFVLILMPLKAMLQVLVKIDFLNAKMLKEALCLMKQYKSDAEKVIYEQFNNRILFDVLNLLENYKQFRRFHKTFCL